jgi:outer membrane immunogenic protein
MHLDFGSDRDLSRATMMNKTFLASVAAATLLGAASASAADLPARRAPVMMPAPVPVFTWSGGYIGVAAGVAGGQFGFDVNATTLAPRTAAEGNSARFTTRDENEIVGGIQTGYRWQFGTIVLGFEQDTRFTDVKSSFTLGTVERDQFGLTVGDSFGANLSFLSATKGQIGFAFDRFLVYATGGLQTGIVDVSASYIDRGGAASPAVTFREKNKFHIGWTLGGGAEYAFTNNVSLGVEGRYFELDRERYNTGAVVGSQGVTRTISTRVDFEGYEVTGRINVKTDGFLGLF